MFDRAAAKISFKEVWKYDRIEEAEEVRTWTGRGGKEARTGESRVKKEIGGGDKGEVRIFRFWADSGEAEWSGELSGVGEWVRGSDIIDVVDNGDIDNKPADTYI